MGLKKSVEIFARNKQAKDEYEEELFKNLRKSNQVKRNFVLEPVQLNEVLGNLDIPLF